MIINNMDFEINDFSYKQHNLTQNNNTFIGSNINTFIDTSVVSSLNESINSNMLKYTDSYILFKDSNNTINYDTLNKKKKNLIDISKNLTKIEYLEIFNIIQSNNCQYTQNSNGVFINLQNVSENIIDKIFNFLNFIKHKKEDLLKQEEYLVNVRKNIVETNEEKTQNETNISNTTKLEYDLSDDTDDDNKTSNYLLFSSDDEDDLDNKISLKKKKTKYSGKKLKMIKSIKDNNENNKK